MLKSLKGITGRLSDQWRVRRRLCVVCLFGAAAALTSTLIPFDFSPVLQRADAVIVRDFIIRTADADLIARYNAALSRGVLTEKAAAQLIEAAKAAAPAYALIPAPKK